MFEPRRLEFVVPDLLNVVGSAGAGGNPDKAVTWEVVSAGSFCVGRQSRRCRTRGRERGGEQTEREAGAMLWNLPRGFWVNVHGWQRFGMFTNGEF